MTAQEQEIHIAIEKLAQLPASGADPSVARALEAALIEINLLASAANSPAASITAGLLDQLEHQQLDKEGTNTDQVLKEGLIRLGEAMRLNDSTASAVPDRLGASGSGQSPIVAGNDSAAASSLSEDPELINDFVVEAREHLSSIEVNLLALEKDPSLPDAVNSVFRSFHTIKGLSGFLALDPIHQVAHETETILQHAREKRIAITPRLIDLALKAADYVRFALDALSSKPPQAAMESLEPNANLLAEIGAAAAAPPGTREIAGAGIRAGASAETTTCVSESPAPGEGRQGVAPADAAGEEPRGAPSPRKSDSSVVRVDTSKLEYLVEMVGELVIAQSLIHFSPVSDTGAAVGQSRNFAHLGRVTGEIQKTVLSMRMVPVSRLYDKMARLVRDLARRSGKSIEVRRIGDQVELDRNIVEEITDPFVHMIRNSVDHGIEDAETRAACGKCETGYITLEAFHQAGSIILRLSDDGRGLRADRIFEKAAQKGLVAPDDKLDEPSIYKLIFEPGFSTAERVTDISGRGVGMDVVRRQIEKLRGTVEITSLPGQGCSFTLKLPLTLAMVDGLILESGGERYVLPIYSVREMFHMTEEKLFTVESRAEMVLLRGSLLPVIRLDRFFAVNGRAPGSSEIGIVVEGRTRQFCLVVDRMVGKQEVVIKSLGSCFRSVRGVAGGAILGDGRVGLILDVHGIDGGGPE